MDHPGAENAALDEVLRNMAVEIARVRNDMRRLEETIGHILAFAAPAEMQREIQQMDLVIQELDDLSRFCGVLGDSLGPASPRANLRPALAALKLRRLVRAIGSHDRSVEADPVSGQVQLF